jgi:hypothetical protein
MKRAALGTAAAAMVVLTTTGTASADTATLGGASASTVGAWVKPTSCSQLPVDYMGLPADQTATIHILDATTRADVGSTLILRSEPRSGRVNIQVCSSQVKETSQVLLSLELSGAGAADSAVFAWTARPNTVRCVNKRTYTIREFPARKCPSGWVKR